MPSYTADELNDIKCFGEWNEWKDLNGGRIHELRKYFKKLGSKRSNRAIEQKYRLEREMRKKGYPVRPQSLSAKVRLPIKKLELSAVKATPLDNAMLDLIDCIDSVKKENTKLKEESERLKKEVEQLNEALQNTLKRGGRRYSDLPLQVSQVKGLFE